jgi:CRISPR-associated protein Cmr2
MNKNKQTMNKYLGITIGPIINTLTMARKPRELWSASYLFSELMSRLIAQIPSDVILSPAVADNAMKEVGLYPDRLFCKNWQGNIEEIINEVRGIYGNELKVYADYFKIYAVEIEADNDAEAIEKLNKRLDYLELHNIALSNEAEQSIYDLIHMNENSPLFKIAFNKSTFGLKYETLAEIASAQLEQICENEYRKIQNSAKETGKDELIKELSKGFGKSFITPHKYICVVHADGDNVGSIVSKLPDGELKSFSGKLLKFGKKACESIKDFQGLPIYAGGDDLLFIAPVVSNDAENNTRTIFDLIKQIDKDFEDAEVPKTTVDTLTPSMSYGISITYYKYPLYEALEMSRNLLFKVAKELKIKDEDGKDTDTKIKNAIAWTLQKGSGFAMDGCFSKSNKKLYDAFESLINSINDEIDNNLVSAAAHKIKANESLLKLFMGKEEQSDRLDAFFEKTLELSSKKDNEKTYLEAVKVLLKALHPTTNNIEETIKITYAMLRTAKFIKGLEEDKDE